MAPLQITLYGEVTCFCKWNLDKNPNHLYLVMLLLICEGLLNRRPFLQKLQIWISKKETCVVFQAKTSLTSNEESWLFAILHDFKPTKKHSKSFLPEQAHSEACQAPRMFIYVRLGKHTWHLLDSYQDPDPHLNGLLQRHRKQIVLILYLFTA